MNYNIHPIIVHFPVAMLFVYSIIKILPLKRWFHTIAWRQIRAAFLVVGVGGAMLALNTGEVAEHLFRGNHKLVEAHSTFGAISLWLYLILLVGEIALYSAPKIISFKPYAIRIKKVLTVVAQILTNPILSKIIAFIALVAIGMTGLLGGVIVYGVSVDPLAPTILKLLGIVL